LLETGALLVIATPDRPRDHERCEWQQVDFMKCSASSYADLVIGVDIVIHLAAELWDSAKMVAVNEVASGALAAAAEAAGVKRFVYSSTVGVYGFPSNALVDEDTPTLAEAVNPETNYAAEKYLLAYSLTKLRGELAISEKLHRTELVVLRFANVASEAEIAEILTWPALRRLWRGPRNTHQVYVGDVAHAVTYAACHLKFAGRAGTYIVSEDHIAESTYTDLFLLVKSLRWEARLASVAAPVIRRINRFKDWIKFRSLNTGLPAGDVRYLPNKLISAGFVHRYGIRNIHRKVINEGIGFERV
jgi:nucleoside-diphosphate-sugar epimerase